MGLPRVSAPSDTPALRLFEWETLPSTSGIVALTCGRLARDLIRVASVVDMLAQAGPHPCDDAYRRVRLWPLDLLRGRGKSGAVTGEDYPSGTVKVPPDVAACDHVLLFDYSFSSIAYTISAVRDGHRPLLLLDPAHDAIPSAAFAEVIPNLRLYGPMTFAKPITSVYRDSEAWIGHKLSMAIEATAIAEALRLPLVAVPHHVLEAVDLSHGMYPAHYTPLGLTMLQTLNGMLSEIGASCSVVNPLLHATPDDLIALLASHREVSDADELCERRCLCMRDFCMTCFMDRVLSRRSGCDSPASRADAMFGRNWSREVAHALGTALMTLCDMGRYSDVQMLGDFREFREHPALVPVAREAATQLVSQLKTDFPALAELLT